MHKVSRPADMNEAFARAFNSREIADLLALYEDGAALRVDGSELTRFGKPQIGEELSKLLRVPGTMSSRNNFCVEHGEIALLRADWALQGPDGSIVAEGSSAEIVRRQPDGSWLYVIDHAAGASLPPVG